MRREHEGERDLRGLRKTAVMAMAGVAAVSAVLVAPGAAWAKSDYGVSIAERRIRVGQTFHVTVSIDDDGGIDRNTTVCLYQALSDHPPVTSSHVHGPYRKLGACQRPAVDRSDPDFGKVRYTLKDTSSGWLTLVVFRGDRQRPETDANAVSRVVRVPGRVTTKPVGLKLVSAQP